MTDTDISKSAWLSYLPLANLFFLIAVTWFSFCERNEIKEDLEKSHKTWFHSYIAEFYEEINKTRTDMKGAEKYLEKARDLQNKHKIDEQKMDAAKSIYHNHKEFFTDLKNCNNKLQKSNNLKEARNCFSELFEFAKTNSISDTIDAKQGIDQCDKEIERLSKIKPKKRKKKPFTLIYKSNLLDQPDVLGRSDELYICIMQLVKEGLIDTTSNKVMEIIVTENLSAKDIDGKISFTGGPFIYSFGNDKDIKRKLPKHRINRSPTSCTIEIKKDICKEIKKYLIHE